MAYKSRRELRRAKGGEAGHGHPAFAVMIAVGKKKPKRAAGGCVEGAAAKTHLGKRARGGATKALDAREAAFHTDGTDRVSRSEYPEREVPEGSPRKRGGHLTAHERQGMPSSEFALPGKGEGPKGAGAGSYPIDTEARARNALARGAQHASPAERATIKRKVHAKYPGIEIGE